MAKYETKTIKISYSLVFSIPNERAVRRTLKKMAKEGWDYQGRSDSERLFGFGAHTALFFKREKRGWF